MFAEKHYPQLILPEELDNYLGTGWYRMGQTIFTTHFLCFGEDFYSAIWVRLPIEGYRFRKNLQKLLNRNGRLFRTEVRKASLTPEKERLFRRYKTSFPGILAPSLKDSLLDGEDFNIFDTHEIAVYDRDKLIATSFFDLGKQSAASIMGIYDPAYSKYSLGFYTMLLEIAFCMEQGILHYYPGYVVPGYSRFDYKLRIGDVEFFNLPDSQWKPYSKLEEQEIPLFKMQRRLSVLRDMLQGLGLKTRLLLYPLFEANLFGFWRAPYLDFPTLLWCNPTEPGSSFLVAVYDVRLEQFQLMQCSPFDDMQFHFNESYTNAFDQNRFFMDLIVVDQIIETSYTPFEIAAAVNAGRRRASSGGRIQ